MSEFAERIKSLRASIDKAWETLGFRPKRDYLGNLYIDGVRYEDPNPSKEDLEETIRELTNALNWVRSEYNSRGKEDINFFLDKYNWIQVKKEQIL